MQTRSFLLLMGLFALLARVPPAPAQRRRAKKCPTNMRGRVRERGKMCLADADCPRNEICCKYGSHQECLLPVGEHPGYCPKANPDPTTRCRFSCTTDKQCGRGKKCCRWGCASRCTEAEPAHPGACPERNALQSVAPAGSNTCTDDRDCVSEQKCCFTRRGLRCTDLEEGLCELPVQPGSCTSSLRRYYYNSTARSCEAFKYSGCKGNANRFHTKEECGRACGQPDFAHDLGAGSGGAALLRDDARPGLCPERRVLNVTAHCRNACEDDRDCSPHQKCYFSGCGHQCIDPERDICKFPAERGPCDAYIPMFHYSTSAKTCKKFIYGGCGGNANRFSTLEVCLWACRYQDICKLPMVRGHCDSHKITYYYNHTNKSCESFIYHGCEGNENRFRTLEACHSTCLYPEVCKLPMDPGPCRAYVPMYYYNPHNQSCVRFTYGGCQGNRNRFATLEQCEASCRHPDICVLPEETGPCCNVTNMYHFSPAVQKCVPFPYGGCQGNANRFATMEDCMETCSSKDICKLPAEPGPCLGHIPQFYYNPVNKTCEKFVYGGCGGNDNRFKTQMECVWKCRNPDVCKLPEQPGPCDAAMLRYHYNAATKTCETFIYGGCQGNENNFETLAECEHACKTTYICRLPLNPGEGNDAIPKYYYDPVGKICEQFTYKGRKGNPNRFATLEECQEACRDPDICKLPRNPGPCDASVQRFYFHSNTRLCTSFHYGGCKGNMNNFVTKEECQETCKGPEKPGSCPPGDSRHCLVTCQKDYECPGVKKCCSSSCGQVCLEPLKERPGGCPPVPPHGSSVCAENCRHDRDCPDQEKCCSNGCGHVCRKLVL